MVVVILAVVLPYPTQLTVPYPPSGSPSDPSCYLLGPSLHPDRFCLWAVDAPFGAVLAGTFDHGSGTTSVNISAVEFGPCLSNCPAEALWTSPDGTGRLVWVFAGNVTLEVLN